MSPTDKELQAAWASSYVHNVTHEIRTHLAGQTLEFSLTT